MHAWPFQYDMCMYIQKVSYHQVIKLHIFLYFSFQLGKLYSCWKMSSTVWRPLECFQEKSGNIYQIIYYLETVWKISWSDMTEDVYVFLYLYHHHENCSNDNFAFLSFFSLQMLEYLIISTFLCNTALVSWTCTMYSCVMLHHDCSSYCPM